MPSLLILLLLGTLSGLIGSGFSWALLSLQNLPAEKPLLLWGLPFLGLAFALFHKRHSSLGLFHTAHLFKSTDSQKIQLTWLQAPYIIITTLLTHLFGGSAGREGTALQLGAGLSQLFKKYYAYDLNVLRLAGMAGGFAAVFGTPLAATAFVFELTPHKKWWDLLPIVFTAFAAHTVSVFLGTPHLHQTLNTIPTQWSFWLWLIPAGLILGLLARLFLSAQKTIYSWLDRIFPSSPIKFFAGGTAVAIIIFMTSRTDMSGLSLPLLERAFAGTTSAYDFLLKLLLTLLTLGAGFKGGEVTPIFVLGAIAGSVIASTLGLPVALMAGLGWIALFAGVTGSFWACILMGMELFGWQYGLVLAFIIWWTLRTSPRQGLYSES